MWVTNSSCIIWRGVPEKGFRLWIHGSGTTFEYLGMNSDIGMSYCTEKALKDILSNDPILYLYMASSYCRTSKPFSCK